MEIISIKNDSKLLLSNMKTVVFIKMKKSRVIKKLNKSYSVVIIPNNNDNIKNFSIRLPFVKILFSLFFILLFSASAFFISSQKVNGEAKTKEISIEELQQQIQTLSQIVTTQNESLIKSKNQIGELTTNNIASKDKINQFTKLFTELTSDYTSKTSRGSTAKSSNKSVLDLLELSSAVEVLNTSFNINEQFRLELKKSNKELEVFVDAIPTLVPAQGKISSPFGMRKHPIKKVKKAHTGVDLSASKGDPILSSASGVVEYSDYSNGYGYNVIIDHKNGYKTLYGHASKLLVKKGDLVKKGQTIALVGSTGVSTGPHLHFEIRIDNIPVVPTEYIDLGSKK